VDDADRDFIACAAGRERIVRTERIQSLRSGYGATARSCAFIEPAPAR
jgi:hypothetical protein